MYTHTYTYLEWRRCKAFARPCMSRGAPVRPFFFAAQGLAGSLARSLARA